MKFKQEVGDDFKSCENTLSHLKFSKIFHWPHVTHVIEG